VTGNDPRYLSTALQAGEHAAQAGAGQLMLTHLWPGTRPAEALAAAGAAFGGEVTVAVPGVTAEVR